MPWADIHIERLSRGERTVCTPHGNSMRPRILSGQKVTLDPPSALESGQAVLCKVGRAQYVHLIKAVKGHGDKRRYLIGNNHGGTNGWIRRGAIYGVVVSVE